MEEKIKKIKELLLSAHTCLGGNDSNIPNAFDFSDAYYEIERAMEDMAKIEGEIIATLEE